MPVNGNRINCEEGAVPTILNHWRFFAEASRRLAVGNSLPNIDMASAGRCYVAALRSLNRY